MKKSYKTKRANLVKEFIGKGLEVIELKPFGKVYEYFFEQVAEEDNKVILDKNTKLKSKTILENRFIYFDVLDKEYILKYTWSLQDEDKEYARASDTCPNRPMMHQYVTCSQGLNGMIAHHLNSDDRNNSLLNLVTIKDNKHKSEYNPKIMRIEDYAREILKNYLRESMCNDEEIEREEEEEEEEIKIQIQIEKEAEKRYKWVTIDILNQEIMTSLIQEIKANNLLDRDKYRNDSIYRKNYNDQIEINYSKKLDSLLEKINKNELDYNLYNEKLNVDALVYSSNSGIGFYPKLQGF